MMGVQREERDTLCFIYFFSLVSLFFFLCLFFWIYKIISLKVSGKKRAKKKKKKKKKEERNCRKKKKEETHCFFFFFFVETGDSYILTNKPLDGLLLLRYKKRSKLH